MFCCAKVALKDDFCDWAGPGLLLSDRLAAVLGQQVRPFSPALLEPWMGFDVDKRELTRQGRIDAILLKSTAIIIRYEDRRNCIANYWLYCMVSPCRIAINEEPAMSLDDILGNDVPYMPRGFQSGSPQYHPYQWEMPEMVTPPPSFPVFHQPPPLPDHESVYRAGRMSQELFEWFMERVPRDV